MSFRFDPNISVIRTIAMLSIIAGHLFTMYNIEHFQFGAIGVEIFFFISGYLYSDKRIDDVKKWLFNRWKRLIVPYWIVLAVSIIIRLILGLDVSLAGVVFSFLNIQGIDRIFTHFPVSFVGGMGHTWFLTVLFFCYFMMLLLKRNPEI